MARGAGLGHSGRAKGWDSRKNFGVAVDFSRHRTSYRAARCPALGGKAYRPDSFGIGADLGHHEHLSPSTSAPTEASGWRSSVRRSIARLVPQPGQETSSQGVPASSAARIAGDHSMSRPVASRRFQRSRTSSASRARGAVRLQLGGTCLDVESSCPNAHRVSIGAPSGEVDPAFFALCQTATNHSLRHWPALR
jgi:hypothetical protein